MRQRYDIDWLVERFYREEKLKFLFFWGHTNKSDSNVGSFCFSQWFELPFVVDDITYKTSEHWMMANKALLFGDLISYHKIIAANNPAEAKELGRGVIGFDEQIWKERRFDIVKTGNIHKFNQNPQFGEYLLTTGDRILVEASPVDTIWGVGLSSDNEYIHDPTNWRGENLLGFALMEVRDFLQQFGFFKNITSVVAPPWKAYPNIESADMFWRMGKGEDLMTGFSKFYSNLNAREQVIFRLTYPEPYDWAHIYQ